MKINIETKADRGKIPPCNGKSAQNKILHSAGVPDAAMIGDAHVETLTVISLAAGTRPDDQTSSTIKPHIFAANSRILHSVIGRVHKQKSRRKAHRMGF